MLRHIKSPFSRHGIVTKFAMVFMLATTFANSHSTFAHAKTAFELLRSGYGVVWEGYASITTCVHDDDAYELGPYLFVCDKYTYEYPYHYGTVYLMGKSIAYKGSKFLVTYLCMEDEQDCIEGSLYRR